MTTKVVLANVSYGIGVQNRYSAFLDDEDALGASVIAASKRAHESQLTKQKTTSTNAQKIGNHLKANGRNVDSKTNYSKQDAHQKSGQNDGQKPLKSDAKRQARPAFNNNPASRQANNKQAAVNQEGNTANNNKSVRNQSNGNHSHQSNSSYQQNKENNENNSNQQGKFPRTNQRYNNRSRQFNDDRKGGHQNNEGQLNGTSNGIGNQSVEEEKRRRQQKRATDLKYKDPEKKEARRQQGANANSEQLNSNNQTESAQGENDAGQRAPRVRRESGRNQDESNRSFKGPRRDRGRRPEGESNEERRPGQQGRRNGDRSQRNRNGFGTGSRNSRVGDDKNQDRQRPIPNFSDKSDFPSLAS